MNCLALDVGGTSVKYGIVDENFNILHNGNFPTPSNELLFLDNINKVVKEAPFDIEAISVAMPGFVNSQNSEYLYGTNIPFSIDFKKLQNFNKNKFFLDNDGNVAAYYEYSTYFSSMYRNLIMLTFGTGIGGGIISDGKLLRGQGSAGELGHILTSSQKDIKCNCGKSGCLEASTSASKWTEVCNSLSLTNPNSELSKAFKNFKFGSVLFDNKINMLENEKFAQMQIIENISNGLVSLFEIFNNEIFVIGGSMASQPFDFISLIEYDLEKRFTFPSRNFPKLSISTQKGNSGILGAASLYFNEK